jgi:hypothetical protein
MIDSESDNPTQTGEAAEERSLVDDLRALADDAQAMARAEYAYQKSRAFHAGQELKRAVIFTALAVACFIVALMALTMGAVLALTPLLTAWGATGVVVGILLVSGIVFALIASTRLRRTAKTLEGENGA